MLSAILISTIFFVTSSQAGGYDILTTGNCGESVSKAKCAQVAKKNGEILHTTTFNSVPQGCIYSPNNVKPYRYWYNKQRSSGRKCKCTTKRQCICRKLKKGSTELNTNGASNALLLRLVKQFQSQGSTELNNNGDNKALFLRLAQQLQSQGSTGLDTNGVSNALLLLLAQQVQSQGSTKIDTNGEVKAQLLRLVKQVQSQGEMIKHLQKSNENLENQVTKFSANSEGIAQLKKQIEDLTTLVQSQSSSLIALKSTSLCGRCSLVENDDIPGQHHCNCGHLTPMKDCLAHLNVGRDISGLYRITLSDSTTVVVYCDQHTKNGGWTVFQRRVDNTTDFYQNWASYKNGFGKPTHNTWLGLETLHLLTKDTSNELRIEMTNFKDVSKFATYQQFYIDGEARRYTLHIRHYSGTAGDSLRYHNDAQFSTLDNDNDSRGDGGCSEHRHGAWWYGECAFSNLNGKYLEEESTQYLTGVVWQQFNSHASLKFTEMKVRRSE